MVEAVEAVELYEAIKRIPDAFKKFTFFGTHDTWLYHTEEDDRVCRNCSMFDGALFKGDSLRSLLSYLDVIGEDKIMVNIHPSCRCYLSRMIQGEKPEE